MHPLVVNKHKCVAYHLLTNCWQPSLIIKLTNMYLLNMYTHQINKNENEISLFYCYTQWVTDFCCFLKTKLYYYMTFWVWINGMWWLLKISILTPWKTIATVTMNWNEIQLPIFIFGAIMDTVWTEKSQGPHQEPTAVHAVHGAMYPSESIHVTSILSQRMTRLQMAKCHILSCYTCKYNSI